MTTTTAATIAQAANALGLSDSCTVHPSGECLDCGSPREYTEEDAEEIAAYIASGADDDSDLYA